MANWNQQKKGRATFFCGEGKPLKYCKFMPSAPGNHIQAVLAHGGSKLLDPS